MKYGILTFHNIPNIGALLQAYGLCTTIRKLGAECDLINYQCDNIIYRELTFHPAVGFLRNVLAKFIWRKTERKIKSCQYFMKQQNFYSKKLYTKKNIGEANKDYDAFISGSDMIWNLFVTGNDFTYFLDFVNEDKPKYSYASSVGAEWDSNTLCKVQPLLHKYNSISVRESDTCQIINDMGIPCKNVVDPTMLLTYDEWAKIALPPKEKDYVLVYFPTKENKQAALDYAKRHGKKVLMINMWLFSPGFKNVSPMDPPSWLGYFMNASAVFTDSYHGILFSLYFHKLFWTGNYGNRILSLINTLGLQGCLLKKDRDLINEIDYRLVDEKLHKLRIDSYNFIKNQILNKS